jgi:hypothetical protein
MHVSSCDTMRGWHTGAAVAVMCNTLYCSDYCVVEGLMHALSCGMMRG